MTISVFITSVPPMHFPSFFSMIISAVLSVLLPRSLSRALSMLISSPIPSIVLSTPAPIAVPVKSPLQIPILLPLYPSSILYCITTLYRLSCVRVIAYNASKTISFHYLKPGRPVIRPCARLLQEAQDNGKAD
ncbi:hypothetical protein BO94DRAFT_278158 [Aspergillus sclerotioniger CBS 115572]|uniref:Uncharacterized protein n=1 Tax=Aspergillus sclerotioniger CBS 115572 TaxID=1450535 RepID=A0A317XAF4_9EURO|nr:hypothetical protein BO94DRAFT_278158 [Aspergillus sclerotioniger CBS 115572]PWY94547.1 hypothetical protein BO94DRAFT_278158 [Aspergillus sclerotioniger CBS 115572]